MIEFYKDTFPPFLSRYGTDDTNMVAVQTTFREMKEKGFALSEAGPMPPVPKALVDEFGDRKVFAVMNFNLRGIHDDKFFVEINNEREKLRIEQILTAVEGISSCVAEDEPRAIDEEDRWGYTLDLEGYRWFQTD